MVEFAVSRPTVRSALSILCRTGARYRLPAKDAEIPMNGYPAVLR